jgi:ABC-2 type transport system ATP-binding protein
MARDTRGRTMDNILEITDLSKDYRSDWTFRPTRVINSLDLDVRRGECFGLLGPNGAGKTTTFKLILGFLRPTAGRILFDGRPLTPAAREWIGFLPEHPYFYEYLSVEETLELFATLYGMPRGARRRRIDEVVERVGLGHKRRAALRSLSKGLLQRVGVAQAILNHPRLLVLDEPMSGLDPVGRRQMRELIREIRDQGTSVIFSSHILPDAEALCDRVGILTAGELREVIEVAEHAAADHFEIAVQSVNGAVRIELERIAGVTVTEHEGLQIVRLSEQRLVDRAIDLIREKRGSIQSITPRFTSLEERFLRHVGQ